MKLEITEEQFNQIQDEIIRLEDEELPLAENWDRIYCKDRIADLKKILESEEIEI